MKIDEFLKKLEEYYEVKYGELKKVILVNYLAKIEKDESFGQNCRKHLYAVILKNCTGQYKTLPDIAIFERYKQDALDSHDVSQQRLPNKNQALLEDNEPMATPEQIEEIAELLEKMGKSV